MSLLLLLTGASVDATFTTAAAGATSDGGSSTFLAQTDATFSTVVASAPAAGGSSTFLNTSVDATFESVTTLSWAWPDTTGWTPYVIGATGGPYVLDDTKDYLITFSAVRTADCDIRGGRNLAIWNPRIGGRKSAPALTSSYDKSGRGLRIQDGSTANNPRTIWIEGLFAEDGTYLSDTIQIALRTENSVKIIVQNFRCEAVNWGNNTTTPNVHADALQSYGGPTTLWIDGFHQLHGTYQGIIINPDDGRANPTGTPEDWVFRHVWLEGDNLTGYGVKYLLWNSLLDAATNTTTGSSWTTIIQDELYTTGTSKNSNEWGSLKANWPLSPTGGLHQFTTPSYDPVPRSLFDANGVYTSPGYSTATAGGGTTSFTTAAVSLFSTNAGSATALGGDTTFVGTSPGTNATFATLADVNTASGGTAAWVAITPTDGYFLPSSGSGAATASGSLSIFMPGVLLGYRVDLYLERPRTRLFGTYEGITAWKKDGQWFVTTNPQQSEIDAADYVVRGGYDTVVTPEVGEELLGEGYGTLTPIYG